MVTDTGTDVGNALRVVLPVIYIVIGIISVIGNVIALQILCASRMVHKALHIFICSIIIEDILYTFIFVIIRSVSYAYLSGNWFLNVNNWCKAEMYLLRIFDFVLGYTIVAMCFDRLCSTFSSCLCIRQLRTGIATVIAIWIFSSYILIPILLFNQTISIEAYGGYFCYTIDESVPLNWLGSNPRRVLDFIDFMFRIVFPIFLMFLFILSMFIHKWIQYFRNKRKATYETVGIVSNRSTLRSRSSTPTDGVHETLASRKLKYMVLTYAIVFIICELPYEIYRAVLTWNQGLEYNLRVNRIDFAIEIPLLILKLINRTINPFLVIFLADEDYSRRRCCRLWCLPCLPCCIGCNECWCLDCGRSIKYELNNCLGRSKIDGSQKENWIPTGYQTINTTQYRDGNVMVTKKLIREEFQTDIEPYYKNAKDNMINTDDWAVVNVTSATDQSVVSGDVEYRPNRTVSSSGAYQNEAFISKKS